MATAPLKSQPLHNFSLPFLKWGHKNHANANHRYRRNSEAAGRDSPPHAVAENHLSPPPEQDSGGSGSKNELEVENRKLAVGSRSTLRNRFSFASCSTQRQQPAVLERESGEVEVDGKGEKEKACSEVAEADEPMAKPWNLRPRKAVTKTVVEIGGVSGEGELQGTSAVAAEILASQQTDNLPKSMRLRGFAEGHGSEKKVKRKFWIALSREEIEEDVYAMTGSRPARRPKKRTRAIQKQVDNVFPGLYLAGMTPDSYRVHFLWYETPSSCPLSVCNLGRYDTTRCYRILGNRGKVSLFLGVDY